MKKLIAMGMIAASACAFAEEKSTIDKLFALANDIEAITATEASTNASVARLSKQIDALKAKIANAKSMPKAKLDALKQKLAELQKQLDAKVEAYKAELKKKQDEQTAKADEQKAKVETETSKIEKITKDGASLVNELKSLFK